MLLVRRVGPSDSRTSRPAKQHLCRGPGPFRAEARALLAEQPRGNARPGLGRVRRHHCHRRCLRRSPELRHGTHRQAHRSPGLPGWHHRPAQLGRSRGLRDPGPPAPLLWRHRRQHGLDGQSLHQRSQSSQRRCLYARRRRRARPDRSVLIYANRCRQAFKGVGIVIGGIEASLRRLAHFDYWSGKVRRSILFDSKADILLYGNAERAIVELCRRVDAGENLRDIHDIRGTAFACKEIPESYHRIDSKTVEVPGDGRPQACQEGQRPEREQQVIELPSFAQVSPPTSSSTPTPRASCISRPIRATREHSRRGTMAATVDQPASHSAVELGHGWRLRAALRPRPAPWYRADIPAYNMIKNSVTIMRGCFGGCTFCSITEHEGRIIQSRSQESILREIEEMPKTIPGFTGVVSDIGGPRPTCTASGARAARLRPRAGALVCVSPMCSNLKTDHSALIDLYRKARTTEGIKKVFIASGVRYDLAVESPEYVKELVATPRWRLPEDRPRAHRRGPALQDDEARHGQLRALRKLFKSILKRPAKSSTSSPTSSPPTPAPPMKT